MRDDFDKEKVCYNTLVEIVDYVRRNNPYSNNEYSKDYATAIWSNACDKVLDEIENEIAVKSGKPVFFDERNQILHESELKEGKLK